MAPTSKMRSTIDKVLVWIANHWIKTNNLSMALTHNTDYQLPNINHLKLEDWYFIICNHQSWADILILQKLFLHKAPFIRFFIKKELFWVPVIGLAWWALDFPFMARHSKAAIAKNPSLKTKDLETTRKTCAKFQHHTVSILNFLEGTRFTPEKQKKQQSPYPNLLRPRIGGFANAIYTMDKKITHVLDVTIVYPNGIPTFWDFLCGKIQSAKVDVKQREIPNVFLSWKDLDNPHMRHQFGEWVNGLWQEKEQTIRALTKV